MSSLRQSAKGLKLCWRGLQAFEFEGGDNGHEDGVAWGSHGDGRPIAVVQRVEKIDPSDPATAARVIVPAYPFALIRPRFLLDRVVKNQNPCFVL